MVMTGHSETGRVLLDCDGPIAFVTLSHPGRLNAISVSMWRELRRIFTELGANADLRCVVLLGEGGNFAAGADIRAFPRERADRLEERRGGKECVSTCISGGGRV